MADLTTQDIIAGLRGVEIYIEQLEAAVILYGGALKGIRDGAHPARRIASDALKASPLKRGTEA